VDALPPIRMRAAVFALLMNDSLILFVDFVPGACY
jgi:hypothetical protein